jgi:hypothetical protein
MNRIYDSNDNGAVAATVYFPWLMSNNCSDIGWNAERLPWVGAGNNISGTLYNNLTLGPGNFTVVAPSIIDAAATLTIAPGTCLYFMADASLDVAGTIIANGTAAAPICFTNHPSTTWWGRIMFRHGSLFDATTFDYVGGSMFNYVVISSGGRLNGADVPVLRMQGENYIYMSNSVLQNHKMNGIDMASAGNGTFDNVTFRYLQGTAVTNEGHQTTQNGHLRFRNCTFHNNTIGGIKISFLFGSFELKSSTVSAHSRCYSNDAAISLLYAGRQDAHKWFIFEDNQFEE